MFTILMLSLFFVQDDTLAALLSNFIQVKTFSETFSDFSELRMYPDFLLFDSLMLSGTGCSDIRNLRNISILYSYSFAFETTITVGASK